MQPTQNTPEPIEPNNAFGRLLSEFRDGESLHELSEHLQKLVQAVRDTGKAGKLVYTLIVKPSGGDAQIVTDTIQLKAPEVPRDAKVFFATEEATLVRDNPNQRELPLREVARQQPPEIKEVVRTEPVVKTA